MENRPAALRSRRVCRFCLTDNEPLHFIYDRELSKSYQVPLSLQIMSCVAIEVYSADGMPQMICNHCKSNLDRCYRFKQQCKKADEALRAYPVSGVLPRPFPPITSVSDQSESSNKRNIETRPVNDQVKKARLDNGERERREPPQVVQRETRAEKQKRENEQRQMYEEEMQDMVSEGENEQNDMKEESKLEPGEIRVHACDQCDRTFPLLQSLQLHQERAHRDRNYKCTECDRMFFSKYDLNKHMTTHSEDKPYSCQICQKQFSRANLLQRHEKIHREELRYECPQCDREFFTPEELEKHEETVHKVVKPYQCNLCLKRFTYKQGLERHEVLHNEDKTFVCEYCKEAFRTHAKLARHLQTHAGHRPYLCKLCPRSFLLSHHLTRHMRTHSVEKNHQCEDCGKSFKRRESLEVHQLTHTKRSGMGLVCDVCNESCRNRADYVTHIKQHIEAGEKMGPDGLTPDKDKLEMETDEEEEEDLEEAYSDDDYEPPPSYTSYNKRLQRAPNKKVDSEEEHYEKEDKKEQVVYVRGKDGNLVKKTIKTLMPIQRRAEQPLETKVKTTGPQVITAKQLMQQEIQQQQKSTRVDETEAQVQQIVAEVFKEHKIPLRNQGQEQVKESPQSAQKTTQPPTIIKEEKIDPPLTNIPKNVKVVKKILVRKPVGSAEASPVSLSSPLKDLVQEAAASVQQQVQATPSTSTGGQKVKRVIVRRIIRQGDKTREVIMNPDGTIIDPAELAKLPAGNVIKRVVVKKPIDRNQSIDTILTASETKRILGVDDSTEKLVKVQTKPQVVARVQTTTTTPTAATSAERQKTVSKNDPETEKKLQLLQKKCEQQRLVIEELQRKQEYEPCDDMLPDRHDESEDEQQLPLKRVFVKRKQSIYDEEREYSDDKEKEEAEISSASNSKEIHEEVDQGSATTLDNAKIIILKQDNTPADVEEMSRELCNILDSTDSVAKMQENVLHNLTELASEQSTHQTYVESHEESAEMGEEERLEVPMVTMIEDGMEQEIITGDVDLHEEQMEEVDGQEEPAVKVVVTPANEEHMNLEYQDTTEVNDQIVESVEEGQMTKTESGLSSLSTQVLSESNDIFETSDQTMEVDKSQEQQNMDDSVIELSTENDTINLNETTDSRDSLEDKLSQMEG